jgi:hypothetical protein
VFPSTTTTNGDTDGRDGMGNICFTDDPDAHFCSLYEIENAMITTGVHFQNSFVESWVDIPGILGTRTGTETYVPSSWQHTANNCSAWGWPDGAYNGHTLDDDAKNVTNSSCDTVLPVACCKQMP